MPRPFPQHEKTPADFRAEALKLVKYAEDDNFEGGLPDIKLKMNCEKHGEVNLIYIPKYAKFSDRVKGIPALSYRVQHACNECLNEQQDFLYNQYRDKLAEAAKEEKKAAMLKLVESRGVSLRNIHSLIQHMDPVNDAQEKAISKCFEMGVAIKNNENAGNLILSGSVGTGKTLIAGSLVNSLTRDGYYARIQTISKIIRTLKGSWARDSNYTEQDVIDDFVKLDLLVIDEIGVQYGSDTEKMFIFDIIDGRYDKMKPTILISNLNIDGIKELIGDRCINRLKEDNGKVIAFDFESQRGK